MTTQDDSNIRILGIPTWKIFAAITLIAAVFIGSSVTVSAVPLLASGQTLNSGDSVATANGALIIMQTDGNLVSYYSGGSPRWDAGTHGNPGARAVMQTDGNFVVYSASNAPLWDTVTSVAGSRAEFEEGLSDIGGYTGELRIYTPDDQLDWSADHKRAGSPFPLDNTILYPNQTLYPGKFLRVQNIGFGFPSKNLGMQSDGNVVLTASQYSTEVKWHTGTHGNPLARLVMQPDGNLVIYSSTYKPLWNSGTHGNRGARAALQYDENLVVYSKDDIPLWSRKTGRLY